MALSFTADTHEVNHGSGSSLDLGTTAGGNTFTILAWVCPTGAISSGSIIWDKSNAGFSVEKFLLWTGTGFLRTELGRATSYAVAQANNLALANGVWSFVALTWDGSAAPKLYAGSLTVPVAEVGYSTSTAGSGAIQDDAPNDVRIGKAAGFGSADSRSIAQVSQWNRILNLGEMTEQQFRRRNKSGCVLFADYWGTGTQPDWSGNGNNATVTGAAVAAHAPLGPPFGADEPWVIPAAAAAAGHPARRRFAMTGVLPNQYATPGLRIC